MSFSTRDIRVLGDKVVLELLEKNNLSLSDAFRAVRYCVQVVREVKEGDLAELKPEVLRVVGYVLKRTNFRYLPDSIVDPLIEDGIEAVLDWVIEENAASPGEVLKVDPAELFAKVKAVVEEKEEEEQAEADAAKNETEDPSKNFDDPRDDPSGTQESQVSESSDGPKTPEGGEDDPTGAPPA